MIKDVALLMPLFSVFVFCENGGSRIGINVRCGGFIIGCVGCGGVLILVRSFGIGGLLSTSSSITINGLRGGLKTRGGTSGGVSKIASLLHVLLVRDGDPFQPSKYPSSIVDDFLGS